MYVLCTCPVAVQHGGYHISRSALTSLHLPTTFGGTESKKSKRSKGLVLTAPQESALVHITGVLRFLTLLDVNKVRVEGLGAVPPLITLATKASRPSLRYNAQSILSKHLSCILPAMRGARCNSSCHT